MGYNKKFENMTQEDYNKLNELSAQIKFYLEQAFNHKDPSSELAQKAAELHKDWITLCFGTYDEVAHVNLAQMYVDDERYRAYYDNESPGTAEFLRDAIIIYTGIRSVNTNGRNTK